MTTDEFVLDTPVVRAFVADVRAVLAAAHSPEEACDALRPRFAELLSDPEWLPDEYARDVPDQSPTTPPPTGSLTGGMGGGIGEWLLFRAGDGSLSLFALVVPPGQETPVHDHLAWGLVGLYRGTQDEEVFQLEDGALSLGERRSLRPGDFYALIPPVEDVHRVRTTSSETSVSIHLLTNDTGCVWRHRYELGTGAAVPFRSGYANVACEEDT